MSAVAALGDTASSPSDTTHVPTSGLNDDGKDACIWNTRGPTLLFNIPIMSWVLSLWRSSSKKKRSPISTEIGERFYMRSARERRDYISLIAA